MTIGQSSLPSCSCWDGKREREFFVTFWMDSDNTQHGHRLYCNRCEEDLGEISVSLLKSEPGNYNNAERYSSTVIPTSDGIPTRSRKVSGLSVPEHAPGCDGFRVYDAHGAPEPGYERYIGECDGSCNLPTHCPRCEAPLRPGDWGFLCGSDRKPDGALGVACAYIQTLRKNFRPAEPGELL